MRFYAKLASLTGSIALAVAAHSQLAAQLYVQGLSSPVAMVQDPTFANVQYVVQQGGRVRVIQNGALQSFDYINVSGMISTGGERGLLGMEFAPDYTTSGNVYFNFTDPAGSTQIARFTRNSSNPLIADISSRYDILNISQPFSNHNGGTIRFGEDGYLYIGMGDGGSGYDPGNRAQDKNSLLGKMLRIDPSKDDFPGDPLKNYGIPPNNPFLDGWPTNALPEIWSFGLRNPWKWTFDKTSRGGTGAMIIADVGQVSWEEIDYEPMGRGARNYGWSAREGLHGVPVAIKPVGYLPLQNPIFEYGRSVGKSITGGYVYRGSVLGPTYYGRYFFADFVDSKLWSLGLIINGSGEASAGTFIEHTSELGGSANLANVSSIDIDSAGELYVVSYGGGKILKIVKQQ